MSKNVVGEGGVGGGGREHAKWQCRRESAFVSLTDNIHGISNGHFKRSMKLTTFCGKSDFMMKSNFHEKIWYYRENVFG